MIPSSKYFFKKTNWLIALIVEGLSPLLRWYARHRSMGVVSDPRSWKRALILGDNHIGDILYRTSSLEALKRGLPDCDFYYLTAQNTAVLLDGNPAICAVLPWARSDSQLDILPNHEAALKILNFDAVLSTNVIRYWPELALAVRLGIPNRVGYVYKGFSGWVTHPMPIHYPQPYPLYFQGYVAALTRQAPTWSLVPRLYPGPADQEEAEGVWMRVGLDARRPVLACFMTTRQMLGTLPMHLIGNILCEVKRQTDAQVLLLGAKEDASILEQANRRYGLDASILAGSLKLQALSIFLGRCDAVVSTDSGPRHLANAVEAPVFFFRNLRSSCIETGRYVASETDLCPERLEYLGNHAHGHELSGISCSFSACQVIEALRKRSGRDRMRCEVEVM